MTTFATTHLSGRTQPVAPFRSRVAERLGDARDSFRMWRSAFQAADRDVLLSGIDHRALLLLGRD
jgi:hypothetical protein